MATLGNTDNQNYHHLVKSKRHTSLKQMISYLGWWCRCGKDTYSSQVNHRYQIKTYIDMWKESCRWISHRQSELNSPQRTLNWKTIKELWRHKFGTQVRLHLNPHSLFISWAGTLQGYHMRVIICTEFNFLSLVITEEPLEHWLCMMWQRKTLFRTPKNGWRSSVAALSPNALYISLEIKWTVWRWIQVCARYLKKWLKSSPIKMACSLRRHPP